MFCSLFRQYGGGYDYSKSQYGGPGSPYTGQIMTPDPMTGADTTGYTDSFDDEPPLLEGKYKLIGL